MTDTKKSARGRPRAFDPEAAAAIAASLFHERGYDSLGVAELGTAMGLSAPSLYAAYGSKAGLFARAVDCYNAGPGLTLARGLDGPGPMPDRIGRYLRLAAEIYTEPGHPRGCMVMNALRSTTDPEARAVAEGVRDLALERIRQVITEDRPDLADALAADVFMAISGLSAGARDGLSRETLTHAAETFAAGIAARFSAAASPGA